MVQNVSFNHSYYVSQCMGATDVSAPKYEKRIVKRNDTLWNIAKEKLGKDAKNQEIVDYMFEIAKFNNLDTKEKRNNLKINQALYIPEPEKGSSNPFNPNMATDNTKPAKAKPAEKATAPKKTQATEQKTTPKETKVQTPQTQAEASFDKRLEKVLNDNVIVRKADTAPVNGQQLYHVVYYDKNGEHFVMACHLDKQGKIKSLGYEDLENINYSACDYEVSMSNNVIKGNGLYASKTYGHIPSEKIKMLENRINELMNKPEK